LRVLLVAPRSGGLYNAAGVLMPPLSLAYVASVLRDNGHTCEIVDLNLRKLPDLADFDIVGITSMTSTHPSAVRVAAGAKAAGKKVVLGGYHASFMDEEALSTGVVDYVVRGEGEYVMLDLVNTLEGDGEPASVKGLSYMEGDSVVRTDPAPRVRDLDTIPVPARDLLDIKDYPMWLDGARSTSVITSRGCPFDCSFCVASRFCGSMWRARSAEAVVDEVSLVKRRFGFRAISFMDDNFMLNPSRVSEICDFFLKRRINVNWTALSRADTIVREEALVEKMYRAGARILFLGIESGDQGVLDDYGKRVNVELFHRAVDILREHGIRTWASFIIGAATETRKMVRKTLDLARRLDPYVAQFSILTPYPGTALFESVKHKLLHKNWSLFDGQHSVFKTDFMSGKELERLLGRAYRGFYLRPMKLFSELGKAANEGRVFDTVLRATRIVLQVSRR
jgi:anaerobic magnesium-protoporphyrin IX monomethyl ester cyclase